VRERERVRESESERERERERERASERETFVVFYIVNIVHSIYTYMHTY